MSAPLPPGGLCHGPNPPAAFSHYYGPDKPSYLFICRWWLNDHVQARFRSPWQAIDTKVTVYGQREAAGQFGGNIEKWRKDRNQNNPSRRNLADVEWGVRSVADITLLRAVCYKSPSLLGMGITDLSGVELVRSGYKKNQWLYQCSHGASSQQAFIPSLMREITAYEISME